MGGMEWEPKDDHDAHSEEAVRDLLEEGRVARRNGPSPALSASFWSTCLLGSRGVPSSVWGAPDAVRPQSSGAESKKERGRIGGYTFTFVGKLKNGFFVGMMAHRALCPCMCEMHSKHSWEVFRKRQIHTSPLQKMPVSPVQMEL